MHTYPFLSPNKSAESLFNETTNVCWKHASPGKPQARHVNYNVIGHGADVENITSILPLCLARRPTLPADNPCDDAPPSAKYLGTYPIARRTNATTSVNGYGWRRECHERQILLLICRSIELMQQCLCLDEQ